VAGTRKAIFDLLASLGFATGNLTLSSPTQDILDWTKSQTETGKPSADYDSVKRKIYTLLDGFEAKSARDSRPQPGVKDALRALKEASLKLGVVTNSGRPASEYLLSAGGILNDFDIVMTRDEAPTMKPRPEGILAAVSRLSLLREESLYVGDSLYDVRAARAAGVRIASVPSGSYSAERLRNEGPDFIIGSLAELPSLISGKRPIA
jgi:phosphoglycolate phosphatase